jgi:AcrR family transcriptional regulator
MAETKFTDHRATDLFGNPVRPNKGRRGRPALEITPEDRDAVEAALVKGYSNQKICEAVGISLPSLKRHFRSSLQQRDRARDRLKLALFAAMARAAIEERKPAAATKLLEMLRQDELSEIEERLAAAREARPEPEGKKQQVARMALDADAQLEADLEQEARSGVRH